MNLGPYLSNDKPDNNELPGGNSKSFDWNLLKGKKIKLSPILKSAIDKNSIQGEFFEGKWSDVGTPERLKLINLGK